MARPNTNRYEDAGDGTSRLILADGSIFLLDTCDVPTARGYAWCKALSGGYASAKRPEPEALNLFYFIALFARRVRKIRVSIMRTATRRTTGDKTCGLARIGKIFGIRNSVRETKPELRAST